MYLDPNKNNILKKKSRRLHPQPSSNFDIRGSAKGGILYENLLVKRDLVFSNN